MSKLVQIRYKATIYYVSKIGSTFQLCVNRAAAYKFFDRNQIAATTNIWLILLNHGGYEL